MIATKNAPRTIQCRDRAEWLEARRAVIGASDSAAIFGVGYKDQSPLTVWESKVRPCEEAEEPKRLRIGRLIEPALRSIFEAETGLPCESPGDYTIHVHPEYPWLGATLDGRCEHDEYGPCVVELKNVDRFLRDEWRDDDPPLKFNVQCQHQMAVTGTSHAFLLGLIGGNEPFVKIVERNDRFIAAMIERLGEFWEYVARGKMPPIDESIASAKVLARLYPEDSGETVWLPDEAADWAAEIEDAKQIIKQAESRKIAAENKVKAALGDATFGEIPSGGRFSWKTQRRKECVVKASQFRVLRLAK